jgi:MFS superfamily sulfate permease-like transporter
MPPSGPSSAALAFAAVGSAVVALMLLAVVLPRVGEDESVNWTIALIGGLVVGVAVYAAGALRKGSKVDAEPPR